MKRLAGSSHSGDQDDRLSLLPDVILACIISFLDTKLAVQTSILSKRWENVWKMIHALNLDSFGFAAFDLFVEKVLSLRDSSIQIESINLKTMDYKIMDRVSEYALSNGIRKLSIDTSRHIDSSYVIPSFWTSDVLSSLSLKGTLDFGKLMIFKGLVSLRLERVRFSEDEPFSCFPNLKELFLVNCRSITDLGGLEVVGSKLSKLIISSCFYNPIPYKRIVLVTPKLLLFELKGFVPVLFEGFDLPDLDTIHIDCFHATLVGEPNIYNQKLNLIATLKCLRNAKYAHLSPSTAEILTSSHDLMIREKCSFKNLKLLNFIPPPYENQWMLLWLTTYDRIVLKLRWKRGLGTKGEQGRLDI